MIPGTTLRLNISQQFARHGFDILKASVEMRAPLPEVSLRQPAASHTIDQGAGELIIDGEEARAALGIKTNMRLVTDMAQQGKQIALQVIGEIAAEGDQLAMIEKKVTIGQVAHQKWNAGPMPIEDTGPFSYDPVHIDYIPHETTIEWNVHPNAEVEFTPQPFEYHYTPGGVDMYLSQKNWLSIDVKGQHLNITF